MCLSDKTKQILGTLSFIHQKLGLQGQQKLLSTCVSIWTEAHKICKAWVLINQILPRRFYYYRLWLNKSNHRIKQADISEPTDINQSISVNQFYPIEALIFIRDFCFLIIYHNSIFSTHVKTAYYSNKWKTWQLYRSTLKLRILI